MFSSQNSQVSGGAVDPDFKYVTMLLHGDGTNGAQNNTFLDSSTNNFTITRNGNTTQGTFTPYGSNWSNYFDGTGDYLTLNGGTPLTFGTGDFTIEFWVYFSVIPGSGGLTILVDFRPASTQGLYPTIYIDGTSKALRYFTNSADRISGSTALNVSTWYHVAVARSGTSTKMFLNGTQEGSTYTDSNSYICGTSRPAIATSGNQINLYVLDGYMSNLRALKGTAQYTATFTPPIAPLTAITNTSLLICQSNRFVDNSTNNFAITVSGNPSVQPFSPFAPTSAYNTTINGGSGYFDGTGDYLSLASNAAFTVGTGDLTIEAWVYITSFGIGYAGILSGRLLDGGAGYPGLGLVIDANKFSFTILNNSNALIDSVDAPTNQWVHVVGVRSGTSAALFVNGVRKVSSTNSENGTSSAMNLGRFYPATDNYYFNGYISNARIIKGTAVYDPTQTTLTVPTAPFTNITNTSLLTNFTNAGIFDNAMKNDLETVGNAQISTSVVKYGTGSMAFDGTGDYLHIRNTALSTVFGTGNWTIEGWCYPTVISSSFKVLYVNGYPVQIYQRNSTVEVYVSSSAGSAAYIVSGATGPASGITINTWAHFAFVKNGSTYTVYINGIAGTAATSATAIPFPSAINAGIGDVGEFGAIYPFTGYIDDLRITNGVARYTAAFTPPTAAFSNQ